MVRMITEGLPTDVQVSWFLAPVSMASFPHPEPCLGVGVVPMPVMGETIALIVGVPGRDALAVHLCKASSAMLRQQLEQLEAVMTPEGAA